MTEDIEEVGGIHQPGVGEREMLQRRLGVEVERPLDAEDLSGMLEGHARTPADQATREEVGQCQKQNECDLAHSLPRPRVGIVMCRPARGLPP